MANAAASREHAPRTGHGGRIRRETLRAPPIPVTVVGETTDLAKAMQNPVAQPNQCPDSENSNFGVGFYNRTQDVINIQPVIPTRVSKNWMLITRVIQPIVWQPYSAANAGCQLDFGDMNPIFFLSPANPGKLIWGPTMVIPSAMSARARTHVYRPCLRT